MPIIDDPLYKTESSPISLSKTDVLKWIDHTFPELVNSRLEGIAILSRLYNADQE